MQCLQGDDQLGEAAELDSGAIRTIAVVMMAFLSPTFCALFRLRYYLILGKQLAEPVELQLLESEIRDEHVLK